MKKSVKTVAISSDILDEMVPSNMLDPLEQLIRFEEEGNKYMDVQQFAENNNSVFILFEVSITPKRGNTNE